MLERVDNMLTRVVLKGFTASFYGLEIKKVNQSFPCDWPVKRERIVVTFPDETQRTFLVSDLESVRFTMEDWYALVTNLGVIDEHD